MWSAETLNRNAWASNIPLLSLFIYTSITEQLGQVPCMRVRQRRLLWQNTSVLCYGTTGPQHMGRMGLFGTYRGLSLDGENQSLTFISSVNHSQELVYCTSERYRSPEEERDTIW